MITSEELTLDLSPESSEEDRTEIFVRLSRSYWHANNGAYMRMSLRCLKRRTKGYNIFDDDCSNVGAGKAISQIKNLDKCKDGIYKLVFRGHAPDYWTGCVEDWHYELVPLEEKPKIAT